MEVADTLRITQEMDEEDESQGKRIASGHGFRRVCEWPSSRIIRVSKGSGGKDRHSKVWTSKGRVRDRRVRLSATTAIQFYDLQDRLGYEQPSKAVDWLLRAAESSISELPSLDSLVDTHKQFGYEMPSSEETTEQEVEIDPKASGELSVWRYENGTKAPEKENKLSKQSLFGGEQENVKQTSSFTELLTGNFSSTNSPNGSAYRAPMDQFLTNYSGPMQMGNSLEPFSITSVDHYHHQDHHQFSFIPNNNLVPVATATGGNDNYNLNFPVSSGLASGYNRETLQSNSPSMLPHLFDGSNVPFFISPAATKGEIHQHHHQFAAGLNGPLQLFYGDANWHLDLKGKGKN